MKGSLKIRASIGAALAMAAMLPLAVRAEVDKKTERLWKSKCATCHGVDGKAQTEQGQKMKIPDMTDSAWQKKNDDDKMRRAILEGVKKDGKEGMDSYKDVLAPDQIEGLIARVREFAK